MVIIFSFKCMKEYEKVYMVSYLCTRNQRYNTCLSVSESRIAPENIYIYIYIYIYTYKYVAFLVSEMECSQTTRNARFTFNKWKTDTNNPVAHRGSVSFIRGKGNSSYRHKR